MPERKNNASKSDARATSPAAVRLQSLWSGNHLFRYGLISGLIAVVVGATVFFSGGRQSITYTPIPTEAEFTQKRLGELKGSQPAENSSTKEKAQYYEDLSLTYADADKYREAIEAFKLREALGKEGLEFYHYVYLARYYHELGDKQAASAALDAAIALVPADNDPKADFPRKEEIKSIEDLRAEYLR